MGVGWLVIINGCLGVLYTVCFFRTLPLKQQFIIVLGEWILHGRLGYHYFGKKPTCLTTFGWWLCLGWCVHVTQIGGSWWHPMIKNQIAWITSLVVVSFETTFEFLWGWKILLCFFGENWGFLLGCVGAKAPLAKSAESQQTFGLISTSWKVMETTFQFFSELGIQGPLREFSCDINPLQSERFIRPYPTKLTGISERRCQPENQLKSVVASEWGYVTVDGRNPKHSHLEMYQNHVNNGIFTTKISWWSLEGPMTSHRSLTRACPKPAPRHATSMIQIPGLSPGEMLM